MILVGLANSCEVWGDGGLPAGMTEADLGVKSIPRNPLLFGILHRMEAVERIGSGIRRIRDLCREHGVAEPLIEASASWVTTTFHRPTSELGTRTGLKQESGKSQARVKARVKAEIEGKGRRTTSTIDSPTNSPVQIRDLDRFGPQIHFGPAQRGDSPLDG